MSEDTAVIERWLPVVGYERYYEVSDQGRARSIDRVVRHQHGGPCRRRGRVLKFAYGPTGHPLVSLYIDAVRKNKFIHVLVLESFVGPCPDGMESCHNNGDSADARLVNLRWDTRSENNRDRVRHGTHNMSIRTACPLDHLLVPPNLVAAATKRGHRQCRACQRATSSGNYYAKRYGRPFDRKADADRWYARIMSQ